MPDLHSDHFAVKQSFGVTTREAARAAERFGDTVRKLGTDFMSVPAKKIEVGDRMVLDGIEYQVTDVDNTTYQATLVPMPSEEAQRLRAQEQQMEREVLERHEAEALQIMRATLARRQA